MRRISLALGLSTLSFVLMASRPPERELHTVTVHDNGRTWSILTKTQTVGESLDSSRVSLRPGDVVTPGERTMVRADMDVTITRQPREQSVDGYLPPESRRIQSNKIIAGRDIKIFTAPAVSGIDEIGGRPTSGAAAHEAAARGFRPSRDVVLEGVGRATPLKKVWTMEATAYSPDARDCFPFADGFSSIGLKAGYSIVAVDPRVIPLGTRLFIEGYGYGIAADVGGAIKGKRVDLCFNTYEEAKSYGRKKVKVYLLD